MRPFVSLGASMGLTQTSGKDDHSTMTTSGNVSYHALGDAVDEAGPTPAMHRYASYLYRTMGPRLRELISPWPELGIKNGRPFRYSAAILAQHSGANAHVHVAYMPTGDGIGDIKKRWVKDGGDPGAQDIAGAIAMAESGGDPNAVSPPNRDGSIDRGLWQINSVHGALSTLDRDGNTRAAISISSNGRNWRPWTTYVSGAYKRFLTTSGETYTPGKGSSSSKSSSANTFKSASGTATGSPGRPNVASGTGSLTGGAGQHTAAGLLGPRDAANTYTGGIDAAEYQRTLAGDDPKRLLNAIAKEITLKSSRLQKVRKALKRRLTAATRSRLQQEATQLAGELRDLRDLAANLGTSINSGVTHVDTSTGLAPETDAANAPDPYDTTLPVGVQSAAALARLTPGTGDDLAADQSAVDYFAGKLGAATAAGDQQGIAVFANALADVKGSIDSLTDSMTQANALQQQRDADNAEIIANQTKLLALGNRTGDLQAQFAAWLSGSIGGRVGLGFQAAGVPGSVARY
jgi:hypothetical protein